jgi:hypothetical protein
MCDVMASVLPSSELDCCLLDLYSYV